jgi:type 1 glutamine amidotransferase
MRWRAPFAAFVILGILPSPSALDQAAGKHLLVVTHTTGFRHDSIPTAEAALDSLGKASGLFDVTFCRTAEDVKRMLVPEFLGAFDGVFFANTTGDLGIPDLGAFLGWVADGHAFLGAHSASDTYHPAGGDRRFVEMLGAEFDRHGSQSQVWARVEDPKHPAVASLASPYGIFDEIYEFTDDPRGRVDVLLSLDRHPEDGHPETGRPGDFPLSWTKTHGHGRVFYTALGHREDVWESGSFRAHLLGAIRWALRTPPKPLDANELSRERRDLLRRDR